MRGDIVDGVAIIEIKGFNPRPCVRGDWASGGGVFSDIVFQSTPLREGRLLQQRTLAVVGKVSIHAPA